MEITVYIHAINAIIALIALYLSIKKNRDNKSAVCEKEFNDLKTKVYLIEDRVSRDIKDIEKLDIKLDDILKELE